MLRSLVILLAISVGTSSAWVILPNHLGPIRQHRMDQVQASTMDDNDLSSHSTGFGRREFIVSSVLAAGTLLSRPGASEAIGPVKIDLENPVYTAIPCPKDKPIPGEKAMQVSLANAKLIRH